MELDLFSAPSGPKACAQCVYICTSMHERGKYYCDLSKKTVRPDHGGCDNYREVRT